MRKLVLAMMTTLNGRLDDPFAWVEGVGDDLYTEIDRAYESFDTILVGRVTYEEMVAYWPDAAEEAGSSDVTKRMAHKMNTYKKFVFSRDGVPKALNWNNAVQVIVRSDDDIVRFVNTLKAQPGGDIHLSGGAGVAQAIIRLGLVDEYHFFMHPVVSPGASWFDGIDDRRRMELISATPFESGVVGLYYRPVVSNEPARPEHFSELVT